MAETEKSEQVETEEPKKAAKEVEKPVIKVTAAHSRLRSRVDSTQRGSSMFSEAPRIGTKILRPGMAALLTQSEVRALETRLKLLMSAGAIRVEDLATGKVITHHDIEGTIESAKKKAAMVAAELRKESKSYEEQKAEEEAAEAERLAAEEAAEKERLEAEQKAQAAAQAAAATQVVQEADDAGTVEPSAPADAPAVIADEGSEDAKE